MNVIQLSDLHFGFSHNTHKIIRKFFDRLPEHDLIIICGDIASHKPKQFNSCLRFLRATTLAPILVVLGNHDLWISPKKHRKISTQEDLTLYHEDVMLKNGVTYLHDKEVIIDGIGFYGFDGWYGHPNPASSDAERMCTFNPHIHNDLYSRSYQAFNGSLERAEKHDGTRVLVTHHNMIVDSRSNRLDMSGDTAMLKPAQEVFDYILYGHTHVEEDSTVNNCRSLNCGSDYDKPRYKIIDIV